MTYRGVSWAGCLAALAGSCAPAWGQVDAHQLAPVGTCGKAEAAKRMMDWVDEDPLGTIISREAAPDTDLLNCNLDVEIVPTSSTSGTIAGSNTFTIKSRVNG